MRVKGDLYVEIAVLEEEDMDAAARIWASAFNYGKRGAVSEWRDSAADNGRLTRLGMKDPDLKACLMILDFQVYFGEDVSIPTGGIGGVASRAEERGRGYAGKLLRGALEIMRGRKQALSLLFQFNWEFYRRLGWDWVGEQRSYSVPTRILRSSPETDYVRAAGLEDNVKIHGLYASYARRYRGPLVRDSRLWSTMLDNTDEHLTFTYLYEKDGLAEGYLTFRGGNENEISIREFVALTARAQSGLLGLLRRHEMKTKRFLWQAPCDDSLWLNGYDWEIETALKPVVQARIVDVPMALSSLKPQHLGNWANNSRNPSVVFAVDDDAAPWNTHTWKLDASTDAVHVEETREAPQLSMDIQALTQAMFGSPSLGALWRSGRIQVHDPTGLETLERLFTGPPVWLNNGF